MVISSEPAGHVHEELTESDCVTNKPPKEIGGTKVGVKVYSLASFLI